MYGTPERNPSFINAWAVALLLSSPVLFLISHWHPVWLFVVLWLLGAAIVAQRVIQSQSDDYRAKLRMFESKQRYANVPKKKDD
jgi:hypothetical protein